jgi:hypothetical protein
MPVVVVPGTKEQVLFMPTKGSFADLILTRSATHCSLAIYIKKYLNAKEELWKLKYFTKMQKI